MIEKCVESVGCSFIPTLKTANDTRLNKKDALLVKNAVITENNAVNLKNNEITLN